MSIEEEIHTARERHYANVRRSIMGKVMRTVMREMTDDELIEPIIKRMASGGAFDTEECIIALNNLLSTINHYEALVKSDNDNPCSGQGA